MGILCVSPTMWAVVCIHVGVFCVWVVEHVWSLWRMVTVCLCPPLAHADNERWDHTLVCRLLCAAVCVASTHSGNQWSRRLLPRGVHSTNKRCLALCIPRRNNMINIRLMRHLWGSLKQQWKDILPTISNKLLFFLLLCAFEGHKLCTTILF